MLCCVPTVILVTRTRRNIMLYIQCLSCYKVRLIHILTVFVQHTAVHKTKGIKGEVLQVCDNIFLFVCSPRTQTAVWAMTPCTR